MGKSPNSLLTDDDDGNCMLHLGAIFRLQMVFMESHLILRTIL